MTERPTSAPTPTTYDEWEASEGLSPSSPEALYAEKAWDAAQAALSVTTTPKAGGAHPKLTEFNEVERLLGEIKALRDSRPQGQIRSRYNAAIDRLEVLSSDLVQEIQRTTGKPLYALLAERQAK